MKIFVRDDSLVRRYTYVETLNPTIVITINNYNSFEPLVDLWL